MEDTFNFTFNGTFDFSAFLQTDKESKFEIGMKYFFYILTMLISFFGNLCISVVVVKTKSLRTKFNIYIVNLAVSDMLMPVVCMWVHLVNSTTKYWTLGEEICKVHTLFQVVIVCTSVFTLTVVTIDRFLATVFPTKIWITQNWQWCWILLIWTASVGIALPWLLYQYYAEIDWIGGHEVICQSKFQSLTARRIYYISFFMIVFVVPLFLMFTLLVVTVIKDDNSSPLGANRTASSEMRKRALYMVLTVLVVLCVCWTPQQSILLWDVYRDRDQKPNGVKDIKYISLYMAYSSSAINPVVYFLYNKCFRHATYQLFKTRCKGENSIMNVSPAVDSRPNSIPTNIVHTTAGIELSCCTSDRGSYTESPRESRSESPEEGLSELHRQLTTESPRRSFRGSPGKPSQEFRESHKGLPVKSIGNSPKEIPRVSTRLGQQSSSYLSSSSKQRDIDFNL